jgi:hypothetical protein
MDRAKRFTAIWAGLVAGLLLLVGGFNAAVDPYGMFRLVEIPGFNELKPRLGPHVRLAKPYAVHMVRPNGIILGNSRTEMGLSPTHPAWPEDARPVYNLAIPGSSFYMQLRHLQHAVAVNRPEIVVVGLDFMDFLLVDPEATRLPGFEVARRGFEDRLLVTYEGAPTAGYAWQELTDRAAALFSLSALTDSIATLALQWNEHASTRTPLGFNPGNDSLFYIRVEGQNALFTQRTRESIRFLGGGPRGVFVGGGRWSPIFDELAALIRFCRDRGIDLRFYIHPYHAERLELFRLLGLWDDFEAWKRTLVEVVARDAVARPDRPPVPLWDFAGYNDLTAEEIPPPGDLRTVMRWHWESGHYREEYGDLILETLLAGREVDPAVAMRLTPDTIEARLRQVRRQAAAFATSRPQLIARLERQIAEILDRPPMRGAESVAAD